MSLVVSDVLFRFEVALVQAQPCEAHASSGPARGRSAVTGVHISYANLWTAAQPNAWLPAQRSGWAGLGDSGERTCV